MLSSHYEWEAPNPNEVEIGEEDNPFLIITLEVSNSSAKLRMQFITGNFIIQKGIIRNGDQERLHPSISFFHKDPDPLIAAQGMRQKPLFYLPAIITNIEPDPQKNNLEEVVPPIDNLQRENTQVFIITDLSTISADDIFSQMITKMIGKAGTEETKTSIEALFAQMEEVNGQNLLNKLFNTISNRNIEE